MTPQRQRQSFPSGLCTMISAWLIWIMLFSASVSALPPGPVRHHHHLGRRGHQFPEYDPPPAEVSTPEASTMPTATVALADSMVADDRHVLRTASARTIILPIGSKTPAIPTADAAVVDFPARDKQEVQADDDGNIVQFRTARTRGSTRTASTRTITLPIRSQMPALATADTGVVDLPARDKQELQADVDDNMVQMRTASTRARTRTTSTATAIPTSPVDVFVDSPALGDHVGVAFGVDNVAQKPVGRTRTNTIFEVPTAVAPGPGPVNLEVKDHSSQSTLRRRAATAIGIGRQEAISDGAIWFFLASFGVFMTGVAWNVYVRVGMERERRLALELALSDQELGKGRGGGAAFGNGPDVELATVPPAVERVPGALF